MIILLYIAIITVIPAIAIFLNIYIPLLTKSADIPLIPGVLDLTYSENRGVAFGLFQDGTVFFAITTSVVITVFIVLLVRNHHKSRLFSIASSLIIGGGLANLYERVAYGYVVDYLRLSFFPPVCNFADYCITAGTVCLIVYLLFFSDFLRSGSKHDET